MIDQATVQRITDAADIVDVVSDYVHLIRRGSNYVGLCPFHNERTPSFSVNKARNFCFCFSCKKGGSPINFIMEKEGISYREALLQLAKKYNIPVEERQMSDAERENHNKRESMYLANEWAMGVMEQNATQTQQGREIGLKYLYERGVTQEAIAQFHLGYALDEFDALIKAARREGYSIKILKELGLIGTTQRGDDYDRFRGRVIFPIINTSGRIIAFGGRDLKGAPAKYINSPESEIYKKSNELYGIFQARQSIVKEDKVYLVEGYMDVIGMWQSGMKNVVASSGTALTDGQINLLHRFTKNITLIYDGDPAGIKASLRGMDMLLAHGMNVRVLLLPDGDDPDSFARKNSPDDFIAYVNKNEADVISFKVKALTSGGELTDPIRRLEVLRSVVDSVAHIPDKMSREIYIQECERMLNIDATTIAEEVSKSHRLILEKNKRQRTIKDFPVTREASDHNDSTQTASQSSAHLQQQDSPRSHIEIGDPCNEAKSKSKSMNRSLYSSELELIKYCVRYAFIPFCEGVDEKENKCMMTLLEYIDDELDYDKITFGDELLRRIFFQLKDTLPEFRKQLADKSLEIEAGLEDYRKSGFDRIGRKDLALDEIKKEEKLLEEEIARQRAERIFNYSRDFSANVLVNHKDDDVRKLCTSLLVDKQPLSKIYKLRYDNNESEEQKLEKLIPQAIIALKINIMDVKLKEKLTEFELNSANMNSDEVTKSLSEIRNLMAIRNEIADAAGGRIIGPK